MGGPDFLSRSSPLTVSQQKAPLVRFLAQQLITQSCVMTVAVARQVQYWFISATSLSLSPVPGLSSELSGNPRTQNDEHSVKSAAQHANLSSLQSLLICVWWEGRAFEGCVTFAVRTWKAPWRLHYPQQADRTGSLEPWEPREQLCTNKPQCQNYTINLQNFQIKKAFESFLPVDSDFI